MAIHSVVITGATSSIGTALIDECIQRKIKVLAIINPASARKNLLPQSELVEIVECGLDRLGEYAYELAEATDCSLAHYDAMIHLAWGSTQGDAARGLIAPQVDNIKYALDAVELAKVLGCEVYVGSGSQAEYGRTAETITDILPCNPETAYGIAKLCAGNMTRLACRQYGIRHVWPRILSAYGPNCGAQTIITYTINCLLSGKMPELSGCEQIWDFIYTSDVAGALLALADCGHDGEIYPVGFGESRTMRSYIEEIRDAINPDAELGIGMKEYAANGVMHLECDISKLTKDTGFVPQVSFERGIRNTIEYLKKGIAD